MISKAIKYHSYPETAVISIIVEDFPSHHRFSVSDIGPGIDPQFHERMFEVFETLGSNKEIDSTGVGLAIVKKTVQSQGGEIEVSSALGQGSTFTFTWPKSTLDYAAVAQMKLAS